MITMRFSTSLLLLGLLCYGLILGPFTTYMNSKPIEEKLGYVPSYKLLKPMCADQKELLGASLVMKVLTYYGGIIGKEGKGRVITESPDLFGICLLYTSRRG